MKKTFKELLEAQNILPYKEGNWRTICIDHSEISDRVEEKKKIRSGLKNVGCGIYIFTNKNNNVLYVGEGIIKERLIRHYLKSYEDRVKGSPRYHYFKMHKEEMFVFYREFPSKYERLAIEAMLITVLEPKYNEWLHLKRNNK